MKLFRIAARVSRIAFGTLSLRDTMLHVDPDTVKGSDLEDGLKNAFMNAFQAKETFFKAIPMDRHMLEDDKAIDKLDKKAGSLVFALNGLMNKMSDSGFDPGPKVKDAMSKQAKHGFIPNPNIPRQANDWGWDAHEIISKLFDIAKGEEN